MWCSRRLLHHIPHRWLGVRFQQMDNGNELPLERCPHCSVAKPRIVNIGSPDSTEDSEGEYRRFWCRYRCASCGGVILTVSQSFLGEITEMWPEGDALSDSIPERARTSLKQAMESLHAPSLAQIGAASAVDSMLKQRGYKDGSLYSRIEEAEAAHLITPEMAEWAHEVRLDANAQRHADEDVPLPTKEEAERTIEFANALAEFLFVLPAMVNRGRQKSAKPKTTVPASLKKPTAETTQ
jgi:hypothetical protein